MNSAIFIPKTIKVGYQKRGDTYTGMLAYVIYYDQKNKLRKETSWQSWRDEKIEPNDFPNSPTSGFVLNKKVGGYKYEWNPRQTYTRVFDPRGFEFEITIPNLLYILENANSIKGKGLEGDFVYGWDGKDIMLIPVEAPEYKKLTEYSDLLNTRSFIHGKDLILGATYQTNKNENWIYLGRYDWIDSNKHSNIKRVSSKKYYFANTVERNNKTLVYFNLIKSPSGKIVSCISKEPVSNYADLMEELEHRDMYSPVDLTKSMFTEYTLDELKNIVKNYNYYLDCYLSYDGLHHPIRLIYYRNGPYRAWSQEAVEKMEYKLERSYYDRSNSDVINSLIFQQTHDKLALEELHNKYHFSRVVLHLANGKPQHSGAGYEY